MAANDNVTVRIVGDASGVAPAVEQAGGSLAGLEPMLAQLNTNMAALTTQMREGFASGAAGAHQLAAGMEEAKVASVGLAGGVEGAILKIHEGAESVRTFQMRAKEFAEAYVAMFAVREIAEFINKMAEASEKVVHLSQTFGMTTGEIQRLQGVATATGISFDALAKGLQFLDRNMANAAMGAKNTKQAMDAVGISMNDGRTQMEKLEAVADKFQNMADGPKKVALAMQLFGRSGAQLIPILNMGRAGIEQLNQKTVEYGVSNEMAIEKGVILADVVNETKLGFDGLQNTLMQALAPALTEAVNGINEMIQAFIESYQQGGTAREVLDTLGGVIDALIATFQGLGQILNAVGKAFADLSTAVGSESSRTFGQEVPNSINYTRRALETLKDLVVFIKDGILIAIDELKLGFVQLAGSVEAQGHVIVDALTFNWGDIEADWNAGLSAIDAATRKTTNDVVAMAKQMHDAFTGNESLTDQLHDLAHLPDELQGIQTPKGTGDFDYNPTAPAKKEKKPKDDLVQRLEAELEAKKTAWAEEQLAQDTAQQYSLQSEVDFWAQALQRTDLSTKDKLAIEKAYVAAAQALQKQRIDEQLAQYQLDIQAAGANWDKKLAILREEQAYVVKMYGAESKEATQAARAIVKAEEEKAKQVIAINEEIAKAKEAAALAAVDAAQAAAEFEVEMGRESKSKLLDEEKQFENERYQIQRAALDQRLQLMKLDPNMDPVKLQQLQTQIEALERQHQTKLTEIDRQAVLQRTHIERNAINSFAQSWAQAIGQLVTLQASFASTLTSLWQGIQQAVAGVIETILEKFIAAELMKIIYGKATATATIASEAAKAGAGGVASMAAAPWPLDMTAPAFGASMSTAALAYQGLASAEGGWWDVSGGMTNLHPREMVLPAWAAQPLRDMLAGSGSGPANFNAPAAGNDSGGDVHLHFGTVIGSKHAMERWARENRHMFGAGARAYARGGGSADPYRVRG